MQRAMHSFLEWYQARTWALCTVQRPDRPDRPDAPPATVRLHIALKDLADPAWVWFLREIPRAWGTDRLEDWFTWADDEHLIYSNALSRERPERLVRLHLHLFDGEHNNAYAGLYDEEGKRWGDACLVIWDKKRPDLSNKGYAPGRCPDTLK